MKIGFHWFVAWRYLMARPRWGSPILVGIAGVTSVLSAALAALASGVLERAAPVSPSALFAYQNALHGAVGFFTLAALALVAVAVVSMARFRERVIAPFAMPLGFVLLAVGLLARPAMGQQATMIMLLGMTVVAGSVLYIYRWQRVRINGALVIAGLLLAAGGATMTIAEYALEPMVELSLTYRTDEVLLPALGLLLAGVAMAVYVAVGYLVGRRPDYTTSAIAGIVLAAAAIYPVAAVRLLEPKELVAFQPPGLEYVAYARYAAIGLGGLGLFGLFYAAEERSRVLGQIAAALLVVAGLCAGLVFLILDPPQNVMVLPAENAVDQQLQLFAAVALALTWLTLVLAVVRYFFSFFTSVSIAGVSIGAMALVIVLSVMSGFENDLRKKILGSNAHVLITKNDDSFTEYRDIEAIVADIPGVVATSPYLQTEVVIAANKQYSNVVVKGVDPSTVGDVTDIDDNAPPGALDRLWPLDEDGNPQIPGKTSATGAHTGTGEPGIETDAGVGPATDAAVPGPSDSDAAVLDPPPPDLQIDFGEPMDFSGGQAPDIPEDGPGDGYDATPDAFDETLDHLFDEPLEHGFDATPDHAPDVENLDEDGDVDGSDDPPPDDMDVDFGEPIDFSGDDDPDADTDPDRPYPDPFGDFRTGIDDPMLDTDPDALPLGEVPLIEFDENDRARRLKPHVAGLPGVLAGAELVKQIHLYVGQEVSIISPYSHESTPSGPVPGIRQLRIADQFYSGMYEYDMMLVYVELGVLQTFLDRDGEVTGIEVRLTDPDNTTPKVRAMRERLGDDYRVQPWQEINASLFSALKLEKIAMFLVLAIIILVASFSILGNLTMLVVEKAREIALFKTLGASNLAVMNIFVTYGLFIGLVGTFIGVVHGLVACELGSTFGLPLNPEVYYIDRLPIHVEGIAVAAVAIAGVIISVIATLYPAYVSARLRPIEGMRYE